MKAPKVKFKFDLQKIKQWLILHVEKLAFGALALVMLYYVYGAVMHETFAKAPDELQSLITRARSNQSSSVPKPPEDEPRPPKFDNAAHEILKEARSDGKLAARPWAPPVVPIDTRRGQPTLLPVQDLQVAADYGAMRCKGRDGTAFTRGFSWIVVTGLVPYEDQLDEFIKNFALSEQRSSFDRPTYDKYEIQRADVVGDGDNEQPAWKTIAAWPQPFDAKKAPPFAPVFHSLLWESGSEEVVPTDYLLDPNIADPLGPLAFNKAWPRSVGHEKLPMPKFDTPSTQSEASGAADAVADDAATDEPAAEGEPAEGEVEDLSGGTTRTAAGSTAPVAAPAASSSGGTGLESLLNQNRNPSAAPAAAATKPTDSRKPNETATVEAPPVDPKVAEARKYKFFRFFDFTAKAGVRYKYRIRLRLNNPNYEMAEQHLRSDANSQDEYVWTPYSEASAMATGPRLNNVLVGGLVSVDSRTAEAVLNLVVRQFDTKTGADMSTAQKVSRGQVANYREQHDGKTIDYKTNMLVVDVLGGERLTVAGDSKQSMPGIAALLDPSGNLVVQTEVADDKDYKERLASVLPPDQTNPRPQRSQTTPSSRGGNSGAPATGAGSGFRGLLEEARQKSGN